MSKALDSIINFAFAGPIGLAVGLIDPKAGKILSGLGAIAVGVLSGQPELIGFGISRIASGLQPGAPKPPQTEEALKSPIPERVSGYGEGRHYMAYSLFTTAPDATAFDVGAFHDGRVDSILTRYLGDTKVAITGDGWVNEGEGGIFAPGNIVRIGTTLGDSPNTAFSYVATALPDQWTTDHRGDGVVTGYVRWGTVKSKDFQKSYPTGGPNQMPLSLAMRRQLVFDWRDETQDVTDPSTWKYSENATLHLAHYELVRDNKDWATHFAPTLAYWTAAADDADIPVPLGGVQAVLTAATAPDADHTIWLSNVNGLAPGMDVVISATGDTSLTETRTVGSISGLIVTLTVEVSNRHPEGSQVTWSSDAGSPATEARYRSCVAHKHTDPHKGVIANLLACCDGWMSPRADGALVVYSGRYYEPTVAIGPDQIVSYSLQDGVDEEQAVNQIAVTYVSANHDYNVVDTDAWEDDDDIAARGKVMADTLSNQVPSYTQARRLAKRLMARVMAPMRGTVTTNAAGRSVIGQRYITLTVAESGEEYFDGPVEVTKLTRNMATGGVTFEWIAADPNIDAWNPATEEGLPAPVGNRVAPEPLATPTITTATATFGAATDGGTGVRIDIVAAGLDRSDVQWFARWRVVGSSAWNEQPFPDVDTGATVELITGFVPVDASVEVEVAYQTGDGRLSDWSSAEAVDTSTNTTVPDDATTITLISWSDAINVATDRIARATTYRWRFYKDDGTTLVRTIVTTIPQASYTSAQAATDGVLRSYIVEVAGVNSAGVGVAVVSGTLTKDAPDLVTGFTATGGATEAEIDFDLNTDPVAGYIVFTSTASGFDPLTQGSSFAFAGSPAFLQNFAAGTFYTKMAAFDAWSTNPSLLNITAETSFTITTGGGGVGGGGGDGGGGGLCVDVDTLILMADGSEKRAGDLVVGDMLRTQHEDTMAWGDYAVEALRIENRPVLAADIGSRRMRATFDHAIWLGGGWVRFDALGSPDGEADIAMITVTGAHTYVSNGVLSHNVAFKE